MGIGSAGCAEEKDVSYEETYETDGGKGIEGCDCIEQVLVMWTCKESTSAMSLLCGW